jgi:hypothetical protein
VTITFGVLIVFFPVILLIKNDYFPWFLIFPGLFLLLGPLAEIYFKSKRNYKSDLLIGETIEYQFDNEEIIVTGQSFSSRFSWNKIYKVTETKDWLLIWQNRQMANVIPKRSFEGDDLKSFKEIVNNQKTLKKKLWS